MDIYDVPEDELPKMEPTVEPPPVSESEAPWEDPQFVAYEPGPGQPVPPLTMDEAKLRFLYGRKP
jgi:hypothetical protein